LRNIFWNAIFLLLLSLPNIYAYYIDPTTKRFLGFLVALLFLIGLSRLIHSKKLRLLVFVPLFFLSYLNLGFEFQYNEKPSIGLVSALVESDAREGLEFVTNAPKLLVYTVAFYILVFFLLLFFARISKQNKKRFGFLITALLIALPLADLFGKGSSTEAFPLSNIYTLYSYQKEATVLEALLKKREGFKFNVEKVSERDLNVILVLGESSRRDTYSVYGYPESTTPNLSQLDSLVVFDDAVSPSNATIPSLKYMLYLATVGDDSQYYSTKSIVTLAKEAQYKTAWLSSQARFGRYDTANSSIALEADNNVFINANGSIDPVFDEALLPHLQQRLKENQQGNFIVMHLYGSHFSYVRRYPKTFEKFKGVPTGYAGKSSDLQQDVNHYLNSIAYTDHILSEIIKQAKSTHAPSCVVYIADHGEYLGEKEGDDFTGHGYPVPRKGEVEVPLLTWCSKEYQEIYPKKWQQLLANKKLKISAEDLFYSVADLMNIDYGLKQKERSFFAEAYQSKAPRKIISSANHKIFNYQEIKK